MPILIVSAEKFPSARIERSGRLCGYGVSCFRHTNADGTCASTECKKSITIGKAGLSEDECRKRLKRWILVGKFHEAKFDPMRKRSCHIEFGGKQCIDLSSDNSTGWSELDPDLDHLLALC